MTEHTLNYDEMSVQELEDELLKLKVEKLAITERQRELQRVRRDKLDVMYLAQKIGVAAEGLTPKQIRDLLDIARSTGSVGDVVITPEAGSVAAQTTSAGVQ